MTKIKTAYGPETSKRVKSINTQPSRTKQSLAESADVNNIIRTYHKTGVLQKTIDFEAQYGDFLFCIIYAVFHYAYCYVVIE